LNRNSDDILGLSAITAPEFVVPPVTDLNSDSYRFDQTEKVAYLSWTFIHEAQTIGKRIIEELGSHARTISQADIGGIAGGDKFIVNGLLFKLCTDPVHGDHYLYGGHEPRLDLAGKASGNALRAAQIYHDALIRHRQEKHCEVSMHVPMEVVIDYLGQRLTAQPLLDLDKSMVHPVYGSADAGRTVHCENTVHEVMKYCADSFHVETHLVCGTQGPLAAAADIECKLGAQTIEGKRIITILDLSRSFPPECPHTSAHLRIDGRNYSGSIFYRMFRPEFLTHMRVKGMPRLSPDAFSGFGLSPQSGELNRRASAATRFLLGTLVPDFLYERLRAINDALKADSDCAVAADPSTNRIDLCELGISDAIFNMACFSGASLHRAGINMRHLGFVRACTWREVDRPVDPNSPYSPSEACLRNARLILLIEMVARTIKQEARRWQRQFSHSLRKTRAVHLLEFVNLVVADSEAGISFWLKSVEPLLVEKFGACALQPNECTRLRQHCRPFFGYILQLVSLNAPLGLKPDALEEFIQTEKIRMTLEGRPTDSKINYSCINTSYVFTLPHLFAEAPARTKLMPVLEYSIVRRILDSALFDVNRSSQRYALEHCYKQCKRILDSTPGHESTARLLDIVLLMRDYNFRVGHLAVAFADTRLLKDVIDKGLEGETFVQPKGDVWRAPRAFYTPSLSPVRFPFGRLHPGITPLHLAVLCLAEPSASQTDHAASLWDCLELLIPAAHAHPCTLSPRLAAELMCVMLQLPARPPRPNSSTNQQPASFFAPALRGLADTAMDVSRRGVVSYAAELGHVQCLRMLAELKADLGARDSDGFPPIYYAARSPAQADPNKGLAFGELVRDKQACALLLGRTLGLAGPDEDLFISVWDTESRGNIRLGKPAEVNKRYRIALLRNHIQSLYVKM
jgi:hypothetical protein